MRQGILASSDKIRRLHTAASKLVAGPLCTACQYAKQRRKTTPGTVKKSIESERSALKTGDLFPGSTVSVDHFACNPLGRLLNTYGKERADDKYKGGYIFVDHATGFVHVVLQVKLNTPETMEAKQEFEEVCSHHGVIPQSYITDEGSSFTSTEFTAAERFRPELKAKASEWAT